MVTMSKWRSALRSDPANRQLRLAGPSNRTYYFAVLLVVIACAALPEPAVAQTPAPGVRVAEAPETKVGDVRHYRRGNATEYTITVR